jgi:hypothetical protein
MSNIDVDNDVDINFHATDHVIVGIAAHNFLMMHR